MKIKARTIETRMVRYRVKPEANPSAKLPANAEEPPLGTLKYELDHAYCEGGVKVHQDPVEQERDKRGTDIVGQILILDHTPDGSIMTVTALDDRNPAEVHNDGVSILGPKIVINQKNNSADVEGRGSLRMPANSNLSGAALKQASVVIIHWRDRMEFRGAAKLAQFYGKVNAQQNDSEVTCHTMHVQFDRPIDFSRRGPAAPKPPPPRGQPADDNPKIETVRCHPAPDDLRDEAADASRVHYREVGRDGLGRIVKSQDLDARSLELKARVVDPGTRDAYQRVLADGPGVLRIWQSGLKDENAPVGPAVGRNAPAALTGQRKDAPAKESDKKLTVVIFNKLMLARDYGNIFQDATFTEAVKLYHCPASTENFAFDENYLPPGSVRLQCTTKLVVSSRKMANGPAAQRLDAYGNAFIRSDEYNGGGEQITSDGPTVSLVGTKNALAWIKNRFSANYQDGRRIVLDRATGKLETTGSTGSTFQQQPKN
jgi:hypothetical protein